MMTNIFTTYWLMVILRCVVNPSGKVHDVGEGGVSIVHADVLVSAGHIANWLLRCNFSVYCNCIKEG